jgi:hypothetical protein
MRSKLVYYRQHDRVADQQQAAKRSDDGDTDVLLERPKSRQQFRNEICRRDSYGGCEHEPNRVRARERNFGAPI